MEQGVWHICPVSSESFGLQATQPSAKQNASSYPSESHCSPIEICDTYRCGTDLSSPELCRAAWEWGQDLAQIPGPGHSTPLSCHLPIGHPQACPLPALPLPQNTFLSFSPFPNLSASGPQPAWIYLLLVRLDAVSMSCCTSCVGPADIWRSTNRLYGTFATFPSRHNPFILAQERLRIELFSCWNSSCGNKRTS